MPHIALVKLLLKKRLIAKDDLNESYDKYLDLKKHPKAMADLLEPIWASVRKATEVAE